MGNVNQGDVAKIIVGPVMFMTAPKGTTLPTLTADAVTWPVGWTNPGYTQDGLSMGYAPTTVEQYVDELTAPVDEQLDKEKATLSVKLAQPTLENFELAISSATLTTVAATGLVIGTKTLEVGGGTLKEVMVGFEGKSPDGFWRVFVGYRAKAKANVALAYKRTGMQIIPVEFTLYADSSKADGKNLFMIMDKTASKTA